jgi:dTDP-4-amino-4,6-dideoxygalactose transaminase
LALALNAENIDTRKYYDPPAHRHQAYGQYYDGLSLPVTELLAERSLSIPMWTNMEEDVSGGIFAALQRIYEHRHDLQDHFASAD